MKSPFAFVWNLCLVYLCYMLCRMAYLVENYATWGSTIWENEWLDLLKGSLLFDTSAILYTNILYAVLMLLPLPWVETRRWQQTTKVWFLLSNGLALCTNLCDSVYFKYTGRRTTATVWREFKGEDNLTHVIGTEILNHWYLVLLGIGMLILLIWLYRTPRTYHPKGREAIYYYVRQTVSLLLFAPLAVCGMRGGFTKAVRPITLSNAHQYVNRPSEAAVILNTPFSLIRTIGKGKSIVPAYFGSDELDNLYNPIHNPEKNKQPMTRKNVVVLIVESFGREYIGAYNENLEHGTYQGYTPFTDQLYEASMSFDYTFCNGRKSIDGMPSILSSIPMFVEPFFLTPASMNEVGGLARELGREGYTSAFFHGAQNGSMGFQAFARATGFEHYYGRTEYNKDTRFGGDKDFDGTWAIWDEPFLQYYALQMSQLEEPFLTAVFTASSHHPYAIPDAYKNIYLEEGDNPIHKCIRYTDHALQLFFETARKQPWFDNTIFVLTSDHTNLSDHVEYKTDLGGFGSPILFYDPSGTLFPAGRRHQIAQQIDIMPTLLSALGYTHPYIAFGKDLLHTPDEETWAVNYNNGIYQYVKGNYLLQFDGTKTIGLYDIQNDWMQTNNLTGKGIPEERPLTDALKAIVQSYMERMDNDSLILK